MKISQIKRVLRSKIRRVKLTLLPPERSLPTLEGPRYFGIGLNKTGTTSLESCFRQLGLEPVASPSSRIYSERVLSNLIFDKENYAPALRAAKKFRSFEDSPWNIWEIYQHLDHRFPDSFFILTERDPERWWRSVSNWLTVTHSEKLRKRAKYLKQLKVDSLEKNACISAYNAYNSKVKEYFDGSENFLAINFEQGEGWSELCGFLKFPIPNTPFPHENRQKYNT